MKTMLAFCCLFAFTLSQSAPILATSLNHQIDHLIHPIEVDDKLEQDPHSSSREMLTQFIEKGGTFVRLDKHCVPFPLAVGDVVFPACSGGNNRSQTLWNLLRPYSNEIALMHPHATQYGFDPYNGTINWQRGHHAQKNDEFMLWAGIPKATKFGWDVFEEYLSKDASEVTPEEIQTMSEYYSTKYFNPEVTESTRKVYLTFAKNAHIHLYRLNQVNETLENVVVVFFPLEDLIHAPKESWRTHPRSIKAYEQLAHILRSRLDFAQLKAAE